VSDVSRETSAAAPYAAYESELTALSGVLATDAVERGLIGPREVPRLWERHILNCAVVSELIEPGPQRIADVGSGAGLPGLVLAIVRPELQVTLIEPLARRTSFLTETVDRLGLAGRVEVLRARAEDVRGRKFDYVTARAVAPLDRLLGWCVPLVEPGGKVLAMKGSRAADEIDAASDFLSAKRLSAQIRSCGVGVIDPATTVVVVDVARSLVSRNTPTNPGGDRV